MNVDAEMVSLAGDMWNELENLREQWTGTDREIHVQVLIDRYEELAGIAGGGPR